MTHLEMVLPEPPDEDLQAPAFPEEKAEPPAPNGPILNQQ